MKTRALLLLLTFAAILTEKTFGQSTFATNASLPPPVQFLGFDGTGAGGAKHLDLKNNFAAKDINFFTNATGTSGSSVQRLVIKNTTGFVGIGVTNPTDILHLHDGPNSALHITSTSTGSASNRGMKMGMLFNSTAGMITL